MKCKNCKSELTRGKKGYICEECDSKYTFEEIESENTLDWEREVLETYPTMIAIPFREMLRADVPTAKNKLLVDTFTNVSKLLSLGIVYDSKGEYEKSLKIYLSVLGENHPNVLNVQSSLISILENISVPEIHQNIHQFLEELYQPNHPFLEEIYEMSGDCFQDVYPEFALSYYNKALSISQNDEIENASSIAIIFLKIGNTYQKTANNLFAIDMFIKARDIYLNIYGENDSDVANCYKKLGIAYHSLNDTPNAIENLEKSLEIYFSLYGKGDSDVAEVCNLLADVYDKIGDSTKAEEYRDRAEGENDEEIEEQERSERVEKEEKEAETHRKQKEEEVTRDSFEKKDSEQNNIAEKEEQVSLGLDAGHLQFKREKAERERQEIQSHKSQIIEKTEHNETPDIYTNSIGMEFVLIPSGEFMMGAVPQDKDADDEEKPQHKVRITKPFYMGKYPVTQEEWHRVMGYNPSEFKEAGNRAPVENISINDIQKFIFQLNDIDGKFYRLPTEGEWEYSARGGTNFIFSFGDDGISKMFKSKIDDYAWYDKISENSTHPVGQKKPNDFELYDMIGNVLEWCEDSTYRYSSTESIDPIGSYSSYQPKILRGGSFLNNAKSCRVSKRFEEFSDKKKKNIGFRLVLVLNPSGEQIEQMKLLFKEQERLENQKKETEQNELLEAEKAKWSNKNNKDTESRRKNTNVSKEIEQSTKNYKQESGKNSSKKGLTSKAKITTVYNVRQIGLIAGCSVLFGSGTIDARVKLVRRKSTYWEGWMESIQISRQDVTSFNKGDECGIRFKDSPDFQEGDLIEFWEAGPRTEGNKTKISSNKNSKTYTNSLGMDFVLVEAGEFMMGAVPQDKEAEGDEKPQHKVRITKPFYMGKYPVTQEEWEKVMGSFFNFFSNNPSYFKQAGKRAPVESVSWNDCQKFIKELNEKEGKIYRLPTEAEWEYAARAGTTSELYIGKLNKNGPFNSKPLDRIGWFAGNAIATYDGAIETDDIAKIKEFNYYKDAPHKRIGPQPVGKKEPNPWGLYDMIGNIWEWCEDWYSDDYYGKSEIIDPKVLNNGEKKVVRGGSWNLDARRCRVSNRYSYAPVSKNFNIGFRLLLP